MKRDTTVGAGVGVGVVADSQLGGGPSSSTSESTIAASRWKCAVLAVVLILAAALAIASATWADPSQPTNRSMRTVAEIMADVADTVALRQARVFAEILQNGDVPLAIDSRTPLPAYAPIARSGKIRNGQGCMLYMNAKSVGESEVIAHEVCHCTLDYDYMSSRGSALTQDLMEDRAHQCEDWLVSKNPIVMLERQMGIMPRWWRDRTVAGAMAGATKQVGKWYPGVEGSGSVMPMPMPTRAPTRTPAPAPTPALAPTRPVVPFTGTPHSMLNEILDRANGVKRRSVRSGSLPLRHAKRSRGSSRW